MSYLSRSSAAVAAQRKWPHAFHTWWDQKVGSWYSKEIMKMLPGEATAWEKADFVHHVEWGITPEGRVVPCLVVTCRREEITETIPEGYMMEPISRELWYEVKDANHPAGTRAKSEIESPVKVVWRLADEMKGAERKAVIAACIELGVNKSTAATQYYKWQQAQKAG